MKCCYLLESWKRRKQGLEHYHVGEAEDPCPLPCSERARRSYKGGARRDEHFGQIHGGSFLAKTSQNGGFPVASM